MSVLGFLLFVIIVIFVFGISVISSVLKAIFGIGKKTKSKMTGNSAQGGTKKETIYNTSKHHKKVFGENEGEYVEFEEVDEKNEKEEKEK